MKEPQEECPRWDKCSVNSCPLDPFQKDHQPHPDDSQLKCTMEKGVRVRIGSKYPDLLPLRGLTPKEEAGRRVWANLPADKKAQAQKRLNVGNKPPHLKPPSKSTNL